MAVTFLKKENVLTRMLHNWNPHTLQVERKIRQPLWQTVWWFFRRLNIELPYDPEILLLSIYPKESKTGIQAKSCLQMFTTALLTIAKMWKQPKCSSTDKCINKMWYTHTMEYYSAIKRLNCTL